MNQDAGTGAPPAGYFTGPMMDMPHFWEQEAGSKKCAVLAHDDNGFLLQHSRDALRDRFLRWVPSCDDAGEVSNFATQPVQYHSFPPPPQPPNGPADNDASAPVDITPRAIELDAPRTFHHEDHHGKLATFLYSMYREFKTLGNLELYTAPICFFSGFCLIALSDQETAAVLRKLRREYICGHWAPNSLLHTTDPWIIDKMMQHVVPDVAVFLTETMNIPPACYIHTYISCLGILELHVEQLLRFLDAFMAQGFSFLVKFILSIMLYFRERILGLGHDALGELIHLLQLKLWVVTVEDQAAIVDLALGLELPEGVLEKLETCRETTRETRQYGFPSKHSVQQQPLL